MTNVNLLKAKVVENGTTIEKIARNIGIDPATFTRKMYGKNSDFYCHEIVDICRLLHISDPVPIFFASELAETQEIPPQRRGN